MRKASLWTAIIAVVLTVGCATGSSIPKNNLRYFEEHNWDFKSLEASVVDDFDEFENHIRYYLMDAKPDTVWTLYADSDPSRQWNGPIGDFVALYDSDCDRLYTRADRPMPGLDEGQILFLDIHIEQMVHIPTAFRISRMDSEEYVIVFNYLEENTSHGMQELCFFPVLSKDKEIITLIRHRSWFSSGKGFRDRVLYKPYHEQTIDEYHFGIAKSGGLKLDIVKPRELKRKNLVPEGMSI